MPFVWVQNIAIGASIDSADIVEIRDAADSVLDNLCVVDNVGELVGENGLDNLAEDGADNPAEDGTNNPGYLAPDDVGNDTPDNDAEDGGANAPHNTDHNPTFNPTDVAVEYAGDDDPHYVGI